MDVQENRGKPWRVCVGWLKTMAIVPKILHRLFFFSGMLYSERGISLEMLTSEAGLYHPEMMFVDQLISKIQIQTWEI